jgi:hypothetical protein
MDCDCTVTTAAGVAFVSVRLRNPTPVARRVRVENRLAGPVLPPRTAGVPEAGWDATGVTVVVRPAERRPLGYACALDATADDSARDSSLADPPAVVVADERASSGDGQVPETGTPDADATVHAVVRDLGRSAPPRDAVPPPDFDSDTGTTPAAPAPSTDETGRTVGDATGTGSPDAPDTGDDPAAADSPNTDGTLPPPVTAWLGAVEHRIETAERLDPDASVPTATSAVETLDVPPTDLPARLAEDRRLLAALAERSAALADRAESASVPAAALRRLS